MSNVPVQRRAAQRTVRCNRLLDCQSSPLPTMARVSRWQRARLPSCFISVFSTASIDDRSLSNGRTHGPVHPIALLKVGDRAPVEATFVAVGSDAHNRSFKETFVDGAANQVFVRPLRHCLGESPTLAVDKCADMVGESLHAHGVGCGSAEAAGGYATATMRCTCATKAPIIVSRSEFSGTSSGNHRSPWLR